MNNQPLCAPPFVPPGGTVAIISPSRWAEARHFEGLKAGLEAQGYRVLIHPQNHLRDGIHAGTEKARAAALNEVFADPSVHAIMCARGGSGANLMLDLIDYDLIRRNPKMFIGFSDATTLLNAIAARSGLMTFHGPMAWNFLPENDDPRTRASLFAMMGGKGAGTPQALDGAVVLREGRAEGQLVGGNLALLRLMIGTPFDWEADGCILFLEEIGEPLYKIERGLAHLRMAGRFKGVKAVIVGEMIDILDEKPDLDPVEHTVYGRSLREILLRQIPDGIPLVMNAPCGHGRYLMTFPIGARALIEVSKEKSEMSVML